MASHDVETLEYSIQHYAQVAEAVNHREMTRFIEEIRQRWDPEPEDEWNPRGDGYTDEGAFILCVCELAFTKWNPPRLQGDHCEAEERNEVVLPPVDTLVDWIPKPITEPRPQHERNEKFCQLQVTLQQQLNALALGTIQVLVELPKDFKDLMAITDGVRGAGVPSETAHLKLVHPLERHQAEIEVPSWVSWREPLDDMIPLAGWEIGCCVQHRQIYYVLCQSSGSVVWKILDANDVDRDYHDNLTEFLRYETLRVEKKAGGAQQEFVLDQPTYPM